MFTFVILAHNEQDAVQLSIEMAQAAAGGSDRVLVVDSASTDGTADAARQAGAAEVIRAPIGKGAAMARAIEEVDTEWVCFLDADYLVCQWNIAERLRRAAADGYTDQVIGDYRGETSWYFRNAYGGAVRPIYRALLEAFFPEVPLIERPLAGARAIRSSHLPSNLPPDYGVEACLNIEVTLSGGITTTAPIGEIHTRTKTNNSMGLQVGRTMLDLAVRVGRLAQSRRPAWHDWMQEVSGLAINSITTQTEARRVAESTYRSSLAELLDARAEYLEAR